MRPHSKITLRARSLRRALALVGAVGCLAPALGGAGCAGEAARHEATDTAAAAQISSTKPDKSITFELYVPTMLADHITDEGAFGGTRDETYIHVYGMTPHGPPDARLPLYVDNDDYYEFWNGTRRDESGPWTNQDQINVGHPRVWNGTLKVGDTASFQLVFQEQENKEAAQLKPYVSLACDAIKLGVDVAGDIAGASFAGPGGKPDGGKSDGGSSSGSSSEDQTLKDAIALCKEAAAALPDKTTDDVIGVVGVTVKNVDGVLAVNTVPLKLPGADSTRAFTADPGDADAFAAYQAMRSDPTHQLIDAFRMTGASSSYYAEVSVKATDGISNPIRYFGKTNDKCRNDALDVLGINGHVTIPRQTYDVDVRVPGADFNWTCDGSWEHTHCDDGTDYVRVGHDSDGSIHWSCFHEEQGAWTGKLADGFYQEKGGAPFVWRMHGDTDCYMTDPAEIAEYGGPAVRTNMSALDTGLDVHTYTGGCAWPHCSDGIEDATETGVDCGGSTCGQCPLGGGCNTGSDCTTGWCYSVGHTCVSSHCQDRRQDADETGIDCGGGCAPCVVRHCGTGAHDCGDGKCISAKLACP